MQVLAETDNFEIFRSEVIQNLIRYRYDKVKAFTVRLLFVPFLLYLFVLIGYIDYCLPGYMETYSAHASAIDPELKKKLAVQLNESLWLNIGF